jgi:hypothetical protein
MKFTLVQSSCVSFLGLLVICHQPGTVQAQGTEFTYQGSLNSNGVPASGVYDLSFALFDAPTGGTQQGLVLNYATTIVSNGLFTVTLDFDDQFPGAYRWLEIGVRSNGASSFTVLTPRQLLTRSPYAVFANKAGDLTGSLSASRISGTLAPAQIPASVITNGGSGVTLNGTFSGTGSGLTGISPTNLQPAETEYFLSPYAFRDVGGLYIVKPDLGAARLSTLSATLADMTYVLPLDVPSTLLGVPQRIKRVKIAYQVATNTANYIYFTRIDQLNDAMQGSLLTSEFQTRTNQSPTTYTLTNNSGATLTGTAYLSLYAMIQNGNPTNYIRVGPVTVTIGP